MEKLSATEVGAHDAAEEKSVAAAASTSDGGSREKQRRHLQVGDLSYSFVERTPGNRLCEESHSRSYILTGILV